MPRALLVFGRDPVPGRVKTRLIPAIGADAAAMIYWQMLRHSVITVAQVRVQRRELWVDRTPVQARLARLAQASGLTIHTQAGADLGERMATALGHATDDHHHAVLIGSDCPGYDVDYIEAAFNALLEHDAVLGPAADGGYVLVGLKHRHARLFEGIAWGSGQVLGATRQRLRDLRLRWFELPVRHDLDRPADLARFPVIAAGVDFSPPTRHDS